ncbi:MAG: tetratricopeptide repeat protein [Planctomycetota bacterium]
MNLRTHRPAGHAETRLSHRSGASTSRPAARDRWLTVVLGITLGALALTFTGCTPSEPPPPITKPTGIDVDPLIQTVLDRVADEAESSPNDAEARGKLGLAYEANQLYEKARESYQNAHAMDRSEPYWTYRDAVCRISLGDIEGAISQLEQITADHFGFAPAWHRLATLRLSQGDIPGAKQAADECLRIKPDAYPAMVTRAEIHLRDGEAQPAIDLLTEVTRNNASDRQAKFVLGRAYQQSGRDDAAVSILLEEGAGAPPQFVSDPRDTQLNLLKSGLSIEVDRSIALLQAGRAPEAITRLERAIVHHGDNASVLSNLAYAYRDAGRFEKGLETADKALELQPENYRLHLAKAQILLSAGSLATSEKRLDEANDFFERARIAAKKSAEHGPEDWRTHFAIAQAASRGKDDLEARDALITARRLDPTNLDLNMWMFETCWKLNDRPRAVAALETAIQHHPNQLVPWVNMVHCRIESQDFDGAREALARAKTIAPNHERVVAAERRLANAAPAPGGQ